MRPRRSYAPGDAGLTPPSRLGQMPLTLPREEPGHLRWVPAPGGRLVRVDRFRPIRRREGLGYEQPVRWCDRSV